jgi:hypothetical protein
MKKKKQKHTRTKREFAPEVVETKDFGAKVVLDDEGHNKLKINSPVWYRHQLSKFRTGETVTLYVSSRRPKRTIQQNRYYWGVYLPLISRETGEQNIEALHKLFSGMFLSEGITEVLGQRVRMTKSTTALSKADFGEYIMAIEAETGIEAPPTANYFDEA